MNMMITRWLSTNLFILLLSRVSLQQRANTFNNRQNTVCEGKENKFFNNL